MIRIPIAFVSNDKGVLMLGIALYSLLTNAYSDTHYVIYILDDSISEANKDKISGLRSLHSCEIHFIAISGILESFAYKAHGSWPANMYARLHLPTLLTAETRVLYMDIDVLVTGDLSELFIQETPPQCLASVIYEEQDEGIEDRKRYLGLHKEHKYFNSGVMLMELERMRRDHTESKIQDCIRQNKIQLFYPDQDILNIALTRRVQGIHPKWNCPSYLVGLRALRGKSMWGEISKEAVLEAVVKPRILHFLAHPKPIKRYNKQYLWYKYRKIWLQSPWKNVPVKDTHRALALWRMFRCSIRDIRISMMMHFVRSKLKKKKVVS